MRALKLGRSGLNKVRAFHKELKSIDIEDSLKSLPPGEWCILNHPEISGGYVCFINSMIEDKFNCINILEFLNSEIEIKNFSPQKFIESKVVRAFEKRLRYKGYEEGARIFYGSVDGLPGLIIDKFLNKSIVQINTAGIDKYRDEIKIIVERMTTSDVFFLDNAKYRSKEFLPVYPSDAIPELDIKENGLHYTLRAEVIQKVGFYYDHRENRYQLVQILNRLGNKYENALDLFCYVGAWGMSALKAGIKNATFVDQGDFDIEIKSGLKNNGYLDQGRYIRADVFKFLDESIQNKKTYDVILCDPPAFAKSLLQKNQALEGYSKLHRKVFKSASSGALLVFSSCTHYVSHEEFQKNVLDAAVKENKKVQLLYSGIQGWDHPVSSLSDKSNYIKCYFYLME